MHLFVELITTLRVPTSDLGQVGRGSGALELSPRGDRNSYDRDGDHGRDRDRDRDRDGDKSRMDRPPLRNEIARTSMNMNISSLSDTGTHTHRARSNSTTPKRSIDVTKSASFFSRFSMKDNSLSRSTNGLPGKKESSTSEFDDSDLNTPNWKSSIGKNRTSAEFRRRGVSADDNVRGSTDSRLSRDSPRGKDSRSRGIRDFERDLEEEHEDESPAVVEMCSGWVMIPIAGQLGVVIYSSYPNSTLCTVLHCIVTIKFPSIHFHSLATLRGSARKLRLTMCGGTPFAVVHIQGDDVPRRSGVWNSMKRY